MRSKIQKRSIRRISRRRKLQGGRPFDKAKIQGRIQIIIRDYLDNAIKIIDPIIRTCAHEEESLITVRQSMTVVKEALSGKGGINDLLDNPSNKAKIQGRIKTIVHDYLDTPIKIIDLITRTCAHEKENLITVMQSMKVVKEALSGNGGISDLLDQP
jgi:hypothetical protein